MGRDGDNGPTGAIVGGVASEKIKTKRKCRDIAFLLGFIAFWIGMIVNSSFGFNRGDPRRLVFGLDYKGNLCGNKKADPDLSKLQVRYWQNPNQVYQSGLRKSPINLIDARSICLRRCPTPSADSLTWVCDYPEGSIKLTLDEWVGRNYDYYEFLTNDQKNTSLQLQGPCYPILFPTTNVFWSCQFATHALNSSLQHWKDMGGVDIEQGDIIVKAVHVAINAPSAVLKRYVADVGKSWPVLIVCGGLLPLALSAVWLLVIRYFVGVMAWATIILLNFFTIAVTTFFYIKAGWIGHDAVSTIIGDSAADSLATTGNERSHLRVVAIIMTFILVVVILATIVLIKRIVVAVAVLKVAVNAIGRMGSLIIFPIIPFIILAIFCIWWVAAALYLFSTGEIRQNHCDGNCCAYDLQTSQVKCEGCCGYSMHYTRHIALAILYHIIGFFWTTQFVIACTLTAIAGAIASYYWARGNASEMPSFPVITSVKRLLRYNLGSMALGSLIVAIIETIRFLLEFVRQRLKALESFPGGCCLKLCWCCVQCCLGCVEWTIKFINRNAYIMIAVTGKGFCKSAGMATSLIISNILRIGVVNVIGDVMLFLGKLCVSLACALFAFLMLDTHKYKSSHQKISSPLFPVLSCWWLGYVVASLFFSVVEMAIDTIMLCFCQDTEEHQGNPQYAPPLLLETLGKRGQMQESH